MKKLALTIAIVLGLGMTSFAEHNGGGLFQRGLVPDEEYYGMNYTSNYRNNGMPMLPQHNQNDNQSAPLGSGIAVLLGLGGAYLVAKKRREE